jgi:phosphoribosylformylglycinamidine cyclo-ligase
VIAAIVNGSQQFFDDIKKFGINIHYLGGETADVGDVVRTIAVNGTMMARWPKEKLVTNEKIIPGDVIVGLAGFGQANYEDEYNSGIGSNGLTSARHDVLQKKYGERFQESYDTTLDDAVVYIGPHLLTDRVEINDQPLTTIGRLLLSPTRTFAPVLKQILEQRFDAVHGLIHCSGGGQTKCMKYMPDNVRVIKDNLFDPPSIFQLIQDVSKSDDKEMYQVFNMGTRMEIYTTEKDADVIIKISKSFGVDAQIIGRVESSEKTELEIITKNGELTY